MKIVELRPFTFEEAREYLTRCGIIEEKAIQEIINFADRLPLALAMSVDLVKKSGTEQFSIVTGKYDLVERLIRLMIPDIRADLRMALEICAILSWFNEDALKFLMKKKDEDIASIYARIRSLPFVYPHPRGLILHEKIKEYLIKDLKRHSPERYKELNSKASEYYEMLLKDCSREEWKKLMLEKLYHLLQVDIGAGMNLFIELFEISSSLYQLDFCQALLHQVREYGETTPKGVLLIKYGEGLLAFYQGRWQEAEDLFLKLLHSPFLDVNIESKIQASLGKMYWRQGKWDAAINHYNKALKLKQDIDDQLGVAQIRHSLGKLYVLKCEWDKAAKNLKESERIYRVLKRSGELAHIFYGRADIYRVQGMWDKSIGYFNRSLAIFEGEGDKFWSALIKNRLGWIYFRQGRWKESEEHHKFSLTIFQQIESQFGIGTALRGLGEVLLRKGYVQEAKEAFKESLQTFRRLNAHLDAAIALAKLGHISLEERNYERAMKYYEEARTMMEEANDMHSLGWLFLHLGKLFFKQDDLEQAFFYYTQAKEIMQRQGSMYNYTWALTNMGITKYAMNELKMAIQYIEQAQELAAKYGYYEQLAHLLLIQGHILLKETVRHLNHYDSSEIKSVALRYAEAMTMALRHNCYVLDEILSEISKQIRKLKDWGFKENSQKILNHLASYWRQGKLEDVPLMEAEWKSWEQRVGLERKRLGVIEQLHKMGAAAT